MSVSLRIGNNFDGDKPARATLKELRMGDGFLDNYTFNTLNLYELNETAPWPASREVTISPIVQYFSHVDELRMTGFADMFASLTDQYWYMRQDVDTLIIECEDYRGEGNSTDASDEVGIRFKITRVENDFATSTELGTVWFDNASFLTTDILWEFNTNRGDGRWWPLYQIPGRKYVRVTIPRRSDSLRIRAYSSNTDEWVQKVIVFPRDDAQTINDAAVTVDSDSISIDDYGYLSWGPAYGGEGRIVYEVIGGNDPNSLQEIAIVAECHYQLSLPYAYDYYSVRAICSTSQSANKYDNVFVGSADT